MSWPETVVLGFGKMPFECAKILLGRGIKVSFVCETEPEPFGQLRALCRRNNVPYFRPSNRELTDLLGRVGGPAVVFSINNNYIFPPEIVQKKNIRIVNFHNSVLPAYPGHGLIVPVWVIFNGEARHGVTWHLVDERLDAGRILCRDIFDVREDDTALTLMMRCVLRGIDLFAREFRSLLDFGCPGEPQAVHQPDVYKSPSRLQMRRKKDLPNGGFLDTAWSREACGRFLRSMDYGPYSLLPSPRIRLAGDVYVIRKYRASEDRVPESGRRPDQWVLPFEPGAVALTIERESSHG
ncbi:MAG TPA: formyltransferase family protein [Candidatus Aminicenantes bacterium]|nr:formyltransferase family protein [Candidatus Aminicenantes bacterium]